MLDITRITSAIAELISNNDGDFADLVVGGNSTDLTAAGETYVITVTRAL